MSGTTTADDVEACILHYWQERIEAAFRAAGRTIAVQLLEMEMPVREFVDSSGTEWRAWEITPDAITPPTRGEDYLADCYQLGWVVLETKRGDRRVRLCPIPRDWHRLSDEALEGLLRQGEMLPARVVSGRGSIADAGVVRSFRYPGGRVWTVSLTPHPIVPEARVLRFSAGARSIDIERWPSDWADQPDDQLIALLRRTAPRGLLPPVPDERHRRWNDDTHA